MQQLNTGYEIVHTVTDYYDGPRQGIADYKGMPHFYECIFDTVTDDYSDLYKLTPVDEKTFRLAMESWAIWRRWEYAFHTGKASHESHPALPEDALRNKELKDVLTKTLQSSPNAIMQSGKFSALEQAETPKGVMRPLQVQWINP
jgi:hypothetical protein